MRARLPRAGRRLFALTGHLFLLAWRPLWGRLTTAGRRLWAFLGRIGLACRALLRWHLWIPFLVLTFPFRWFYNRLLKRPLAILLHPLRQLLLGFWLLAGWVGIQLRRGLTRLFTPLVRPLATWIRERWHSAEPWRRQRRRRLASRLSITRARLRARLRRPPATVARAPVVPGYALSRRRRLGNLVTVLVSVNVVILGLSFVLQQDQPSSAAADGALSATPTGSIADIALTPTIPWPTPDPLSKGGTVAFTLRLNGQSDIYALAVGQAEPVRLTATAADEADPAWSPDGRQLAFASRRDGNWELYLLDLPSGETRRLTDHIGFDGAPSWSPDGQWIVFESYRADNLDLYVIPVDSSRAPIRLTQHLAPDFSPDWAPGGRHIAFTSLRSGNRDLFLMSLDAASDATAVNLTSTPDNEEDSPVFHPQADFLAFDDISSGFELVFGLPLAGYSVAGAPFSLGQGRTPAWSPGGEEIVYSHSRGQQDFLIAAALDAWRVAPQAYVTTGALEDPSWTAVTLPRELPDALGDIAQAEPITLFEEEVGAPQQDGAPYLLRQLPVNAPGPYLNDRVDNSFAALRERVLQESGWDFLGQLDHIYEPLAQRPLPGQADRNWNKAGRAFDIYYRHALAFEPQVEVVREDQGNETYWRIYLRTALQDGSQGAPLRQRPWDFRARYGAEPAYYDAGGKLKDTTPAGYYVDFTALAADYGWERVPADPNWRTFFPGIQFWHFENRQGLTWHQAMLELYLSENLVAQFGER